MLHASAAFKGGYIQSFQEGGEPYMGDLAFYEGDLIIPQKPCASHFISILMHSKFIFKNRGTIVINRLTLSFTQPKEFMKKNHLMVFGLYQRWFRRTNKDFCEKSFLGRYGSVVLQQQWEDMVLFLCFFQNINLCCG